MSNDCTITNGWGVCDIYPDSLLSLVVTLPTDEYQLSMDAKPIARLNEFSKEIVAHVAKYKTPGELGEVIVIYARKIGKNNPTRVLLPTNKAVVNGDRDLYSYLILCEKTNDKDINIIDNVKNSKRTRNKTVKIKDNPDLKGMSSEECHSNEECTFSEDWDICDRYDSDGNLRVEVWLPNVKMSLGTPIEITDANDKVTGLEYTATGRESGIDGVGTHDTVYACPADPADPDARILDIYVRYNRVEKKHKKTRNKVVNTSILPK